MLNALAVMLNALAVMLNAILIVILNAVKNLQLQSPKLIKRGIAILFFALLFAVVGYVPSASAVSITSPGVPTLYVNGACTASTPSRFSVSATVTYVNADYYSTYWRDNYNVYMVDANDIILYTSSADIASWQGSRVVAFSFGTINSPTSLGLLRVIITESTAPNTNEAVGTTLTETDIQLDLPFDANALDPDCPANTSPVFQGGENTSSVLENQTYVRDINSTDDDDSEGDGLVYSISGGADQALFAVDSVTGALSFSFLPDYENPSDNDTNNIYEVQVSIDDSGREFFDGAYLSGPVQTSVNTFYVTIINVFETTAPIITGGATAAYNAAENQIFVADIASTDDNDAEGAGLVYSISGGADQALFNIATYTGLLTFKAPPDFENPSDIGANNIYDVQVAVSDSASLIDTQDITITVTDVAENSAPIITGGAVVVTSIDENQTSVVDIASSDDNDSEGSGLTYSISGGADSALFSIVAGTGVLSFSSAPDFESPADVGTNNIYDVQITLTDSGALTDVQDILVIVNDVVEGGGNVAPVIAGGASATISMNENQTAVVDVASTDDSDSEGAGNGLTYSISGGADLSKFSVSTYTGILSFNSAPDFENPTDVGANNIYDVQVSVTDSGGLIDVQDVAVTVVDVVEGGGNVAPTITGGATAAINLAENQTLVSDIASSDDADSEGSGLTYSLSGGVDLGSFSISSFTGVLSFNSAPDFENPTDVGANNIYDVQISVTDSGGLIDVQDIAITVTNVAEGGGNAAPVISGGAVAVVSVDENQSAVSDIGSSDDSDSEGSGLTYDISGGVDAALFSIVSDTGVLTFNSAPNYENPADSGGNNIYELQVRVTDSGALNDVQEIIISINDLMEGAGNVAPVISGGVSVAMNVSENQVYVIDVNASDDNDSEGVGNGLTYSITGGADQGKFNIAAYSGLLIFNNAPDFENPSDAGANNVYDVQVSVTDSGFLVGVQNIAISVTNTNEDVSAPTLVINGAPTEVTSILSLSITYTFSEAVTGFDLSDVRAGLINATASNFAALSATSYTANITPTGAGDIVIGVNANAVIDGANNGNAKATPVTIIYKDSIAVINQTKEKIEEYIGARSGLLLSNRPKLTRRINRITGRAKPAPRATINLLGFRPSIPAPININIGDGSISYAAILSQISDDEEEIENEPKVGSIDVWSEGNISKFNDGTGGGGYFGSFFGGVDYLLSPKLLIGVAVGIDTMEQQFADSIGEAKSNGYMIGPYALFRFDKNFYLDASASWGQSINSVSPFGTYVDEFLSDRLLFNGSLVGEFSIENWTISPSVSAQYIQENQHDYTDGLGNDIAAQTSWQGDVRFSPRVSYKHTFVNDVDIVSWTAMSGSYNFNSNDPSTYTAPSLEDLNIGVSAGIDLTTSEGMNFAISTNYDGIGKDANSYGLSLRFRAPLN